MNTSSIIVAGPRTSNRVSSNPRSAERPWQDRVRERPPIILGIGRTRILVRLEQLDEIAKQCAGAMDLQPFVVFERSRDVVGDDEVRLEEPCQWASGRR